MNDKTRAGRPRGSGNNRDRILTVARDQFAEKGFSAVTMRGVAIAAGVDVALVAHYFGGKEALFSETMQLPPGITDVFVDALTTPLSQRGERLTTSYFEMWESATTGKQVLALARSMLSNEVGSARFRDLLAGVFANPDVATGMRGRAVGFSIAMSHLFGTACGRYLTRVPALAELEFEVLVAHVAPAVQLHLEATDPVHL